MKLAKIYRRHRCPPEIIQYAVSLYHRFNLCHRDVEDLIAERRMHKFKSMHQAQRFLGAHAAVYKLFDLGRHLVSAENYRHIRLRAFATWEKAVEI
jgi:transposase-like protein